MASMRPVAIALLSLFAGCTMDVEEADARCRIIGAKSRDATPVEDASWFQKNCVCEDGKGIAILPFGGTNPPPGQPGDRCVAPGSKRATALALESRQRQEEAAREEARRREEVREARKPLDHFAVQMDQGEFGAADVSVAGAVDKELVVKVTKSYAAQIRFCFEEAVATNPRTRGKVFLSWTIGADGRATNPQVDRSRTTLEDTRLHECMMARIETWQFPRPKGGGIAVVTYPWTLQPLSAP